MDNERADRQKRLEQEIAMLRQRLEAAEEMHRAIAGGEVDGFVVGLTDEDRRILLLDAANPHYAQMVHRMQQGATTLSRRGDILYANQRFAAMLGEPLAQLFTASLLDHVSSGEREGLERFLAAGTPDASLDVTLRRPAGTTTATRLSIVSVGDSHISLLVTDLTLRERMNEAEGALEAMRDGQIDGVVVGGEEVMLLSNAYRPYQAMVERMQQGAVAVTTQGDVLYTNDRFSAMVGIAREKLVGGRLLTYFLPSDRDALQELLEQSKSGAGQGEVDIARSDGSTLPVLVTGAPIQDDGTVALVFTDLTEQRRHREIEAADRRKDEFLAVLAHELRNPLAPIRNMVQVLSYTPDLPTNVRQGIDIIARQSATLTRLLDDLLDINRLNQGKITLQRRAVDLKSVVESAVETVLPFLQERNHSLELEVPSEALWVDGDPVRLTQVVLNLLSNAAKYTREGGRVRLELRSESGADGRSRAVVRVSDTGIGIPAHLLRKVFEPYAQLSETADTLASGLGLGLTVARRLIELHEGSIAAHSGGLGQGSEFVIELPLIAVTESSAAVAETRAKPVSRPSGMRILVADDNSDSVQSLSMLLELSGHEIRTAKDGVEALRVADEFRPHIVFLDIGMPKLDGYATARELRTRPWAEQVALFALTGWGQAKDKRAAQEAGFDAHLVKPLDPDSLEQLIESRLREPRP